MSYIQRPFIVGTTARPVQYNSTAAALRHYNAAGVLNYNAPYTLMMWAKVAAYYGQTIATAGLFGVVRYDMADYAAQDCVWSNSGNVTLGVGLADTVGGGWTTSTAAAALASASAGQACYPVDYTDPWTWAQFDVNEGGLQQFNWGISPWVHLAIVRTSPTSVTTYVNGVAVTTRAHAALGRSVATAVLLGARKIGTDAGAWTSGTPLDMAFNGKLAYARAYARALSETEIATEAGFTTDSLGEAWADWPLTTNLFDVSGNDRHLELAPNTPDARLIGETSYTGTDAYSRVYRWDADVPTGVVDPVPAVMQPFMARVRVLPAFDARVTAKPLLDARVTAKPLLDARVRVLPSTLEELP